MINILVLNNIQIQQLPNPNYYIILKAVVPQKTIIYYLSILIIMYLPVLFLNKYTFLIKMHDYNLPDYTFYSFTYLSIRMFGKYPLDV